MTEEVRIPDIGDVDHVEVIEICVAVGDTVGPDDALIVIESDKASMDVPAGRAGTIASVDVAVGDEVSEGSLVVTLETEGADGSDEEDADSGGDTDAGPSEDVEPDAAETGESASAGSTSENPSSSAFFL